MTFQIEFEAYPEDDVDRQMFEDLALVMLERRRLPEGICVVLRPKGHLDVTGRREAAGARAQ